MRFSVIIPVYNEVKNIKKTVIKIEKNFKKIKNTYEILFIDDNSSDGTWNELVKISKHKKFVKFYQHGKKEGLGLASNFGYSKAKGKIIMQIDGDLAHNPKDLISMYNYLKKKKVSMVIGSRYIDKGKQRGKTIIRDLGSRLMNFIARIFLNIHLKDFTHTFRVFKKEIYHSTKKDIIEKGHPSFFIEFTYLALNKKFKILEYPVTYDDRNNSADSKIPILKESIRYIKTVLRLFYFKFLK